MPIWPLVPRDAGEIGMRVFQNANENLKSDDEELNKSQAETMQLPIERLVPFPMLEGSLGTQGKETCALCEYILHFIQEAITNPTTEVINLEYLFIYFLHNNVLIKNTILYNIKINNINASGKSKNNIRKSM